MAKLSLKKLQVLLSAADDWDNARPGREAERASKFVTDQLLLNSEGYPSAANLRTLVRMAMRSLKAEAEKNTDG